MPTILKLNRKDYAVLLDGGSEAAKFTTLSAAYNWSAAKEYIREKLEPTTSLRQETLLFETNAQRVTWITDDGDGTEPKKLCANSLLCIYEDEGHEVVLTGEEALQLFRGLRKMSKNLARKGSNE